MPYTQPVQEKRPSLSATPFLLSSFVGLPNAINPCPVHVEHISNVYIAKTLLGIEVVNQFCPPFENYFLNYWYSCHDFGSK